MYSVLDLRPRNTKVTNEAWSIEDLISKHASLLLSLYIVIIIIICIIIIDIIIIIIIIIIIVLFWRKKMAISTFSHVSIISINPLELQVLIHLSA